MTNKEAIKILGLECDEWDISHCTASERREAFRMAITALDQLDNNSTKPDNSTATQSNGIGSKVKGLNACRVPENDAISRQAAISAICNACGKIDCDKMDKCEKLQLPPANCSEFPNNSDIISRQAVIESIRERAEAAHDNHEWDMEHGYLNAIECIEEEPSAQPEDWMERNKERILQAGLEGREIEFRIGGRLFAIREKAQ